MRVTLHYGQGLASHNDRTFGGHADHIDTKKSDENIYWQCYKGGSFASAEYRFYEYAFGDYITARNKRAERSCHPERATSPGQYFHVETEPREASRSGRKLADYKAEQAHQKAERAIQAAEQAQKLLQETNAMLDRLGDAPALTEHILALEAYLDSYNVDNGRSMLEAFSEEEQHYNQEQTLDWEER